MRKPFLCLPALLIFACSGNDESSSGSTAGNSGGESSSLSSSSQGGSSARSSGGDSSSSVSSSGGSSEGSSASGGKSSSSAKGGSSSASASSSTDGSGGQGGGGSQGGGTGGGKTPTGGSSHGGSVKGGTATGGAGGSGGAGGKGGTATAGSKASGGTASGGTASGGTVSGGAVANSCANLSFAPSGTGTAKPSGAAGGLKVLDWAGFKSAISYTFDDANSSQINNYTAMNSAGGHYTFYLQTGKSEARNQVYKTALKDGHEMGNHTSDHSNCDKPASIDAASSFIESNFGVTAYSFAAPNGADACKSVSSKFLTNRSVAGGSMSAGDTNSLKWLPSDIASSNNMAPQAGKWRTICIHGFSGGSDGAFQPIPLDSFTNAVKSAVSGGSWVETVTNVAAYQVGQNAISKASGNNITWTLPAVFPPNMCVRVTTTGGTVKQNGKEIPWDEHGYYEIALDAKSLTIE